MYEEATERLKHQAEVFDKLGLGDGSLKGSHLQRWMWDWHQKLQKRLESEISEVIKKEQLICESAALSGTVWMLTEIRHQPSPNLTPVWDHSFPSSRQTNSPLSPFLN